MKFPSKERSTRRLCLLGIALLASLANVRAQSSAPQLHDLYDFGTNFISGNSYPGPLVQGADGFFYGTSEYAGAHGTGTIFKVGRAGDYTELHAFTGNDPNGNNVDGQYPQGGLVLAGDGSFYGVTSDGGAYDQGTFFKITPAGALTVLHAFGGNSNLAYPIGGLLLAGDGKFYGATGSGGANGFGAVFQITMAGAVTDFFDFKSGSLDAAQPTSPLVQDASGNFYGTTAAGGAHDAGTVFQLTAAGTLTILHSFNTLNASGSNNDGTAPSSAVIRGKDGNFYGTTQRGGTHGGGVVYKVTPAGNFYTLHNFDPASGDGIYPFASLMLARDGYLYGTTELGGANGNGTVFRIKPSGSETVLYSFNATDGHGNNVDGAYPLATLVQGKDNNLYGTTYAGGRVSYGTVFLLNPGPAITSSLSATITYGQFFTYQITATNSPTSFVAGGLLPGLSLNAKTGVISGTIEEMAGTSPTSRNDRRIALKAVNIEGTDYATLTLTVIEPPPVITSPTQASATVGEEFTYQITATHAPRPSYRLYSALPPGLSLNFSTGIISGTPTKAGTYTVSFTVRTSAGGASSTLTITVAAQ